jgi:bisphosphoglycerate-dependent phosphoglycerate mutase
VHARDARSRMSTPPQSIQVFYVRHGQSMWNQAQKAGRDSGMSEPAVRALGDEEQFTDAPLTAKGVKQAIELRTRLFGANDARGALGALIQRAEQGSISPPAVLTSNLRRALDTALLSMRPVIEKGSLTVVPAMQETCHYSDCTPLPRTSTGAIAAPAVQNAQTAHAALVAQAKAHEEAASASDVAFVREAYVRGFRLAPHQVYDDRRRRREGEELQSIVARDQPAFEAAMAPLASRVGDILSAVLAAASSPSTGLPAVAEGVAAAAPSAVVLAAHSRLLRELLFSFHARRLSTPAGPTSVPSAQPAWGLKWDDSTNSADCAALASDHFTLNNCGVVSFELFVCVPGKSTAACAAPQITLRNCALDASSKVEPRKSTERVAAGTHSAAQILPASTGLLIIILLLVASFCVGFLRRMRQKVRSAHRD